MRLYSTLRSPLWVKSGTAHNEPMMSAFHPIANEQRTQLYVGFVPQADLTFSLLKNFEALSTDNPGNNCARIAG